MHKGIGEELAQTTNRDVLCLVPWIALHVAMNGSCYPCCFAAGEMLVGSVGSERISSIWNSENMRELRSRMLQEQWSSRCAKCYERETSGFRSLHNSVNANFSYHLAIANDTRQDGDLSDLNIAYLDRRFRNVCNFAGRTCGPGASTGVFLASHAIGWYPT